MKVPLNWLKDFTDINVPVKELAGRMTLTGFKVREISDYKLSGVYAGRIISIEDHPDSDHLHILKIDTGRDEYGHDIQIVCGAPNIYEGMICPVAVAGAVLPELEVTSGKLRGVESYGMCCSGQEIGSASEGRPGADEYGLWDLGRLPEPPVVGTDLKEYLRADSFVIIDFEITSNRPDCYCIEGLGREASAALGTDFIRKESVLKLESPVTSKQIEQIGIEIPDHCGRYCARLIEDVKTGPSPDHLANRLKAAGIKPSGNISDITAYVLRETGQKIRAFDPDDRDSASFEMSSKIIFEAACPDEASSYLNGIKDPENTLRALDLACSLVESSGCGKVSKGLIDVYPVKYYPRKIGFDPARINRFLGTDASETFMVSILTKLGCRFESDEGKRFAVIPPYRRDLLCEADICEEIARFYGYNNIEPTLLSGKQTTIGGRTREQTLREKIKDTFVSCGFYEAVTYSFENPRDMDLLRIPEDSPLRDQIRIKNPLGTDTSVMRTTMLPSLLKIAARNSGRGVASAKVFELAYVYIPSEDPSGLPMQKPSACGFFYDNTVGDSAHMFYHVRGILEEIGKVLAIDSLRFAPLTDNPSFHPGRTAKIIVNDKEAGVIGIIHPEAAYGFEAPQKACFFEFDVSLFTEQAKTERVYRQLPKFPGISKDIVITVNRNIAASDIVRTCKATAGKLLKEVEFFDVFENEDPGSSLKSIALSLIFSDDNRTLVENDVKEPFESTVLKLKKEFDAQIR